MIGFNCESCGARVKAQPSLAGKTGKCPKCGTLNRVPPLARPAASEPETGAESNQPAVSAIAQERDGNTPVGWAAPVPAEQPRRQGSLVNCPDCGRPISRLAPICPGCGRPMNQMGTANVQPARPVRVEYNRSRNTFIGTMPLLVKCAMRAVQELGWKLENANEQTGLVTFETTGISWGSWSGVACSLNIVEVSENEFRVTGAGKQIHRGVQTFSLDLFGEANGKAEKAIEKMKQLAR